MENSFIIGQIYSSQFSVRKRLCGRGIFNSDFSDHFPTFVLIKNVDKKKSLLQKTGTTDAKRILTLIVFYPIYKRL